MAVEAMVEGMEGDAEVVVAVEDNEVWLKLNTPECKCSAVKPPTQVENINKMSTIFS